MRIFWVVVAVGVMGGCDVAAIDAGDGSVWIHPDSSTFAVGEPITVGNDSGEAVECAMESDPLWSERTVSAGRDWTFTVQGPAAPSWLVIDCGDAGFWRMSAR